MSGFDERARRGMELMSLDRHREALVEWTDALREVPDSAFALTMMARCQFELGQKAEAYKLVDRAQAADPTDTGVRYTRALFYIEDEKSAKAEREAREALKLDPEDPDLWAALAAGLMGQSKWKPALAATKEALELDAEHPWALNIRTHLLSILGDDQALHASLESLAIDAESSHAHVAHGYTLLRKGQVKESAAVFTEALRLDPSDESAREGLKESLRGLFPPYRWLQKFGYFCQRLGNFYWVFFIGLIVGRRVVAEIGKSGPPWVKVLAGSVIVVTGFFMYGWFLLNPLVNLALRLHPQGKYILTPNERLQSTYFGVLLSIALVSLAGAGIASAVGHPGQSTFITAAVVAILGNVLVGLTGAFTSSENFRKGLTHFLGAPFAVGSAILLLVAPFAAKR